MLSALTGRVQPTPKPIDRVGKLLKEMPWLWAVKLIWTHHDTIEVMVADKSGYLDWNIPSYPFENKSICYVRVVTDRIEQMIKVELEGTHRTFFDVMLHLHECQIPVEFIERFVSLRFDGHVRVDHAPTGDTFKNMFGKHPRAPKAT